MERNTLPPNARKANRFRPRITLPKLIKGRSNDSQGEGQGNRQGTTAGYARPIQSNFRVTPFKQQKNGERLGSILSTIGILIMAPLIALGLTTYVFQSYEVDGPSMQQTLQDNDRLIVWKAPKSIANFTNRNYIPSRGEIIVFNKSDAATFGTNDKRQLIKRVVGLPSERIVVREGKITIYNQDNPFGFDPDIEGGYSGDFEEITQGNIDLTIPRGEVFVMGDNRSNSLDSRTFGTVPSADIVGSLILRLFPLNEIEAF